MKRIITVLTLIFHTITYADLHFQVIGFANKDLRPGWNEIKIDFDAIGDDALFSTLDRIGHISPPEAVVGDELVFDLDGFHQKYRFASFNATNSTYSLVLAMNARFLPQQISLDWIPLPRVFWINHTSTNSVCFTSRGEVSLTNLRKLESMEQPVPATKQEGEILVVRPILTNDTQLIYTFKGGRICSTEAVKSRFQVST